MVERTPLINLLTHAVLLLGLVILMAPLALVVIAASHDFKTVNLSPMPLIPGGHLWENLRAAWVGNNFGQVMFTSLVVAFGVAAGKIILSAMSAFSIVYFRYRLRMVFFWIIFITLMLPLEVRIVPTYAVAANALSPYQGLIDALASLVPAISIKLPEWNLLNTYQGLILPLVATATGTFLYRQFFLTVPEELTEAARMDGAGALRFFWDVLLPLSKTNMAALGVIMFVWAWNQYLWPILVVTDQNHFSTATMQLSKAVPGLAFGEPPVWNTAMAATLIVMVPPLIVVILAQRWFVRGLISTEK
ncbi:MAG: ABC transporter permease subunit [Alphaproteobacteria bacterium]|nr:ABC transporter permease subunit [Alphaproteobacteria bacterium]